MKKIIWLFVLVLGGCFYFITNGNEYANDYYNKINEEFLSHDYLGDDEYIYNNFVLAQEKSNEVRDSIIKDMVSGKVKTNSDVRKLYNNVLDYSNRNSVGIGPLREYIDKIMNSNNCLYSPEKWITCKFIFQVYRNESSLPVMTMNNIWSKINKW